MEKAELTSAVVGLGHVGMPTALGLAELGWRVLGADDDADKVRRIAAVPLPRCGAPCPRHRRRRALSTPIQRDRAPSAYRRAPAPRLHWSVPPSPSSRTSTAPPV